MILASPVRSVFAALAVLVAATSAAATTLARPSSPCELFQRPKVVIVRGTVLGLSPEVVLQDDRSPLAVVRVRLRVDERIRGVIGPDLAVFLADAPDASPHVEIGESYVMYVQSYYDDRLWLSEATPLADATDELEILHGLMRGQVKSRLYGEVGLWESRLSGRSFDEIKTTRLPGVDVIAESNGKKHRTRSDADGRYRFVGLPPGDYVIEPVVEAPLQPQSPIYPSRATLDSCAARGDVRVIARSVIGRVRRADGTLAEGATVVVVDADVPSGSRSTDTLQGDDHFIVRGVPDGRYIVGVNVFRPPTARSPYPPTWYTGAAAPGRKEIVVSRTQPSVGVDIVLPPPLPTWTIHGRVVDVDGKPVYWAMTCLIDAEFPEHRECRDMSAQDGTFTVRSVAGRRVRLVAEDLNPPRESEEMEVDERHPDRVVTLTLSKRLSDLVIFD